MRRAAGDVLGPDHPTTLFAVSNLAASYLEVGRPGPAVRPAEAAVRGRRRVLGRDHPDTVDGLGNLAAIYLAAGRAADALPVFAEFVPARRKQDGAGTPEFAGLLAQVSLALLAAGQSAAAEPYLRECLAIREKVQPGVWNTFNTRSMLGGALLGQGNHTQAEPLLVAGYDGMKARAKTIPPEGRDRLPEAADRLVELYVSLNKPDEVKRWRAERATYPFVAPPPRPANRP